MRLRQLLALGVGLRRHRLVERLGRLGHLAVDQRDENHLAGRRTLDREAALARPRLEIAEQFLRALVVLVAQRRALLIEILAPKRLRQLLEHERDQLRHLRAQLDALPRLQIDRDRRFGIAKIVYVHPIAGRRHRRGFFAQNAQDRFALMPRAQAAHENVVARRVDSDREPDRVERAALPEQFGVAIARRRALQRAPHRAACARLSSDAASSGGGGT